MSWRDLLFMHWPVDQELLRPLIPRALTLDAFDGSAWLSITPFFMSGTRPRALPSVPPLSDFPELNVRTYVTARERPGIWFFSLDARSRVAVRLARAIFKLPYYDAKMSSRVFSGSEVRYESVRTHRGAPGARFAGRYRPVGDPFYARPGTLDHFLSERYCLYSADSSAGVLRGEIHHPPWPLQEAEVEVETLEMTAQIGLTLPASSPRVAYFSSRLDTLAWPPRRIGS
jgi:uncharacterized protein